MVTEAENRMVKRAAGITSQASIPVHLANRAAPITFFAPEADLNEVLGSAPAAKLRVATLDEIFASKALVCADRSKTRDWFDLYPNSQVPSFTLEQLGCRESGWIHARTTIQIEGNSIAHQRRPALYVSPSFEPRRKESVSGYQKPVTHV